MKKIENTPSNATNSLYVELLRRILSLELPPGSLLSSRYLAEEFEMSKTPVRDALQKLEADGLVLIYPKSRTVVSKINIDDLKKSHFLRLSLELEVVRELTLHHDEETIKELTEILEKQKSLIGNNNEMDNFSALDLKFHETMFDKVGQKDLFQLLRSKSGHMDRARRLHLPEKGKCEAVIADHGKILDAIKNGDVKESEAEIRSHLKGTISRIESIKEGKKHFFD